MSLRQARAEFAEMLATYSKLTVVPNPPRQAAAPGVYMIGFRGERETQDGGDSTIVTLLALAGSQTDYSFDELMELIDGSDPANPTSLIDIIDAYGYMRTSHAAVIGDWLLGWYEVGGIPFFGAALTVELTY